MDRAIIEAVFKREPLWNPNDNLRKNAFTLKKLWEDVGFELQKDAKLVKARWRNLRAYFYREFYKIERSKLGGADGTKIPTWKYYYDLSFLKGYRPRNWDFLNVETMFDEDIRRDSISETMSCDSRTTQSCSPTSPVCGQPNRKRRRSNQSEDSDPVLIIDEKRLELDNDKNSDVLFFDSLLPYMADIPLARKLRLRSKIQDLIVAEMEAEDNTQE